VEQRTFLHALLRYLGHLELYVHYFSCSSMAETDCECPAFVLIVLFSPYTFPVTAQTFNFSCVVFFAVVSLKFFSWSCIGADECSQTVMGIVSYFMVDDAVWLSRRSIARVLDVSEGTYVVEKVDERTVSKDDDVSKEAEMVKEE
jgi:hypothetical protein